MKKIIFLSAIAIAALASCNEQGKEAPKNTDLAIDNLKGNVEQTIATDYKVDSAGTVGEQDSCCVVTSRYDKNGYITEYNSVNKSGTENNKQAFTHYDNGAMKNILITKNGNTTSSISIQTDKDGKYATAQEMDSANKLTHYYTDLGENDYGAITSMKRFNADSTLSSTMTNTYNQAIYTGGEQKDSTGKVTFSSSVKLDDKNNIIENTTETVTKDSTIHNVEKYKYDSYDDKGNWTQRTKMNKDGKPELVTKREITYYPEK
jgi:hypothetical protein